MYGQTASFDPTDRKKNVVVALITSYCNDFCKRSWKYNEKKCRNLSALSTRMTELVRLN